MADIWAHRGASRAKPENTVDAFREAKALGADGVELDVRRSRDRGLVIHHDATLPDGRAIVETDVADLPPGVPLLDAALDACDGMSVNIEIKNVEVDSDHDPSEYLADAVVGLVRDLGLVASVLVSSFSLATIDRVRRLAPEFATGYLASPRWNQIDALQRAIDGGHGAFHPMDPVVNAELVQRCHDAGVKVNTWTVDDPDRIRWLVDECGVDAVITNVPDVARTALDGR
ncbi:MAG TPA: glycerophosphodiester phosphodiesterase [Acidimicrobiales bacterium]|nr:glycerophosphodiester phosphodiesterase [Acidimicrobiales bacterium]